MQTHALSNNALVLNFVQQFFGKLDERVVNLSKRLDKMDFAFSAFAFARQKSATEPKLGCPSLLLTSDGQES
eukprot:12314525-Karenia_brevis.AAC.1